MKEAGGEGDGRIDCKQALKGHAYGLGLFQNGCVICPRKRKSPARVHISMMAS